MFSKLYIYSSLDVCLTLLEELSGYTLPAWLTSHSVNFHSKVCLILAVNKLMVALATLFILANRWTGLLLVCLLVVLWKWLGGLSMWRAYLISITFLYNQEVIPSVPLIINRYKMACVKYDQIIWVVNQMNHYWDKVPIFLIELTFTEVINLWMAN